MTCSENKMFGLIWALLILSSWSQGQSESMATSQAEAVSVAPLTSTTNDGEGQSSPPIKVEFLAQDAYIAKPSTLQPRDEWLKAAREYRQLVRGELPKPILPLNSDNQSPKLLRNRQSQTGLNRCLYDEKSQEWLQGAFTCHFTFMYDAAFYDAETNTYTIDSFLDDAEKEFGGYDILLLWHAYPRLGVDHRNQLDYYKDMPGGIDGIRGIVKRCNERGVKVFLNYNPWDTGTHRIGKSDEDFLADLVLETQVDGIFLDTMSGDSAVLRQKLDSVRPGITLAPEENPRILDLGICNSSWAQRCYDPAPPSLDHRKWLEPRHMRWQTFRWNLSHREEIRRAFFGGGGMIVWENIFGVYNPWNVTDRYIWKKASSILRHFTPLFVSDAWEPYYPPASMSKNDSVSNKALHGLYIHQWPGPNGESLFTLWAEGGTLSKDTGYVVQYPRSEYTLFERPYNPTMRYFDIWNGREIHPIRNGEDTVSINGVIDRHSDLGCYMEIPEQSITESFLNFLKKQKSIASTGIPTTDTRNFQQSVKESKSVEPTPLATKISVPSGMNFVPGGKAQMTLEHPRRECGCYPDPDTPVDGEEVFTWGEPHYRTIQHHYEVEVAPFMIDQMEVSNAQFKKFLDATKYTPKHQENFLAHWTNGEMPLELSDHPVVYVDLDDARAYATWAGKRLPTEVEWHFAAQGEDGRTWPWGNERPTQERGNRTGGTLPVDSLPAGRSPYGCYNMCGNVYEWTESERNDGHTRFVMIRGGSYFQARGSGWYVDGGPRPNTHHAKFILMWSGLDRCDTVGFRCVKDIVAF